MCLDRLRLLKCLIPLVAAAAVFAGQAAPASASVCTLADHIRAANINTAVGFCPAGTSHDIITITDDIVLSEALPAITGTITIEGGGHTISGAGKFRIFDVDGGQLTINNLTLTAGKSAERVGVQGPGGGGAIKMRGGAQVALSNVAFRENRSAGYGGAILVSGYSRLRVEDSMFLDNSATGDGGAIAFWYGRGDIHGSGFRGNSTRGIQIGGAIFVGIGVELEVTNSSFSGNSAGKGGAIGSEVWTPGGAIASRTTLRHLTLVDNIGQAIHVDEGDKHFSLYNSIIAGKSPGHCAGPLNESIGNLIADGSCSPAARGDPLLAEAIGAPIHFPLLDGSPALDAADPRFCPDVDQIGTRRPQGAGCDIGAIESTTATPAATPIPTICTLRDQIIAANTDAPYKACPAGYGADVIHMVRDYALDEALPKITSDITIHGSGFTISGARKFQIFDVDGGKLRLSKASLIEGRAANGGAIQVRNGGVALISDVRFQENRATRGGAIATFGAGARLNVERSAFSDNGAESDGGAIYLDGGVADISESAFLENSARQHGGAIEAHQGGLRLSNSTFYANRAETGGGIYVHGAEATLTHLTLIKNLARRVRGAGVHGAGGPLHLRNSLVAGSGGGDDCSGSFAEKRGNFSGDGSCAARAGGDPLLGEMVETPSFHFPLLDRSPAHGAADGAYCMATDQIGNARRHCDIGAIETARSDAAMQTPPADESSSTCTLADQIIAANTDAPAGKLPGRRWRGRDCFASRPHPWRAAAGDQWRPDD